MATRMLICEDDAPIRRLVSARIDASFALRVDAIGSSTQRDTPSELLTRDIHVVDGGLEQNIPSSVPEATGNNLQ